MSDSRTASSKFASRTVRAGPRAKGNRRPPGAARVDYNATGVASREGLVNRLRSAKLAPFGLVGLEKPAIPAFVDHLPATAGEHRTTTPGALGGQETKDRIAQADAADRRAEHDQCRGEHQKDA